MVGFFVQNIDVECAHKWSWHELLQHISLAQTLSVSSGRVPNIATPMHRSKQTNLQTEAISQKEKHTYEYSHFSPKPELTISPSALLTIRTFPST